MGYVLPHVRRGRDSDAVAHTQCDARTNTDPVADCRAYADSITGIDALPDRGSNAHTHTIADTHPVAQPNAMHDSVAESLAFPDTVPDTDAIAHALTYS